MIDYKGTLRSHARSRWSRLVVLSWKPV